MTKRAQLADGRILEFPDDTPDAVIDRVVRQEVGRPLARDYPGMRAAPRPAAPRPAPTPTPAPRAAPVSITAAPQTDAYVRPRATPDQRRRDDARSDAELQIELDRIAAERERAAQAERDAGIVGAGIGALASAGRNPMIAPFVPETVQAGLDAAAAGEALRDRAASGRAAADFAQNDGILDRSGDMVERSLYSAQGGLERLASTLVPGGRVQDALRARVRPVEAAANSEVAGETTWEAVKADPISNILPFIYDTTLGSAVEMGITAAPYVGMPLEAMIQTGRIGQQRAQADGRADATFTDSLIAAPFGIGATALERLGIGGIASAAGRNAFARIGRAGLTEGLTEAGQSSLEYTGGSLGTQAGYDPLVMLDQAAAGAVGGVGMGGGMRAGGEAVDAVRRRAAPRAPITPADRASPIPDDLIAEGRAAVGAATGDASVIMPDGPGPNGRVQVHMPNGTIRPGTIEQSGETVSVAFDDGTRMDQPLDMLVDAGVRILPGSPYQAAADAIDAGLAASAASVLPAPAARPVPAPASAPRPAATVAPTGNEVVGRNARAQFKASVRTSESGGDDRAANPRGSASGRYQFIQSTFTTLYQRVYGSSPQAAAQAWANNRFDPDVQERLMDAAIGEYSAAFRRAGVPETAGNLYLAHFLGPQGAVNALRVDPRTPAISHFGEAVVNSNPEVMRGKTVGDVIAWTRRRMGEGGTAGNAVMGTPAQEAAMPDLQMTEFDPVDFGQPADRPQIAPIPLAAIENRRDTAVTTTGREVPVQYAVAELRDLIASNDVDGNPNPAFPADRQPRDRTRVASRAQVQDIAANLNPRLLGRSPKASDGAPIISPDGVVESGNGRTIALQLAYGQDSDRAAAYRQMIEDEGFDTVGVEQPVLVRVRDGNMAPDEVEAFIREANSRDTAAMSGTESAESDAASMPAAMLDLYRGGDIDAAGNRDLVRAFMQAVVPVSEQGQMVMKDGQIAKQLLARIESAMLVRAFGRQPFVEKLVDATDSNIRTIGKALIETGPQFAKLREAAADGRVDPAMDISAHVSEAVEIVDRARREGRPVASFVQQRDIFSGETVHPLTEAVLRMMYARPDFTRPVSQKRLVEALNFYLQEAEKAAPGGGLFGESTKATPDAILVLANEKSKRTPDEDGEQPDLLSTGQPGASDDGRATPGQDAGNGSDGGSVPAPGRDDVGPGRTGVQARPGQQGGGESVAPQSVVDGEPASFADFAKERDAAAAATAPDLTPEQVAPDAQNPESVKAETDAASTARIEPGSSDKSIVVVGASEAELAAIAEAVPNAKPTPPRKSDGGVSYSKKHEAKIRAALEGVSKAVTPTADALTGDKISAEWAAFSEDSRTLGIPRADMPQVKAEHRGALTQFLAARGITHTEKTMNPGLLRPTQAEYSPAKVAKARSYDGGDRAILVSNDGYVVDGHHQWMAAVETMDSMSNTERALGRADIRVIELGAPIRQLLDVVPQFPSAETAGGAKPAAIETAPEEATAEMSPSEIPEDPPVESAAVEQPPEQQDSDAAPETDAAPIDDFGEKLAGARKDTWTAYADKLREAGDVDVAAQPLSKSWPEPDYQKLLDDGADPWMVAFVRSVRDEVPTKPQRHGVRQWAENVQTLRKMASDMLSGDTDAAVVKEKMLSPDWKQKLRDLEGRVDLYQAIGHGRSLKGISLSFHHYSLYRGEKNVSLWSVEQRAKATAFSNWPREIVTADSRSDAIAKFKGAVEAGTLDKRKNEIVRFDIYSRRGAEPGFYIGKKVGKDYVDLKRFDTAKEARAFKVSDEGYAELLAALEQFKKIPPERKEVNSPRIGFNHRNGADVSPAMFNDAFGFRGVQFGNYVEGPRRQADLNQAYDALMDLAGILGIPPKSLSLNGQLGLAFGARGKGGKGAAAAHYEPGTVVINLTKGAGAGSLAHEWWHSLDNYFARMRTKASGGYMTAADGVSPDGVRPEMVEAFAGVMRALRQTAIKQRSSNLDKRRTKAYWATDIEMSARAFESYVIAKLADEQFSNDYLANVVSEQAFSLEEGYPYPTAAEIDTVRAGFDGFFAAIEAETTARGVRLYSQPEQAGSAFITSLTGDEVSGDGIAALRDAAVQWYRDNLLAGEPATTRDGKLVRFNGRGMRKVSSKGESLLRAVPAIRSIIEKGDLIETRLGDNIGTKAMHVYGGRVDIAGEVYSLGVMIRETPQGTFHYDLTKIDLEREGVEGRSRETDGNLSIAPAGSTLDTLNLFSLPAEINGESGADAGDAAEIDPVVLRERLKALGLSDKVTMAVVDSLGGAAGDYGAGGQAIVRVARDTAQEGRFTLDHEAIHALREMGLFAASEWKVLESAAKRDAALMRSIARRYSDLDAEAQLEEAVADMFARWSEGQMQKGMIARLFQRLRDLFDAIRNALRGDGFASAGGVMRAVDRGDVGQRDSMAASDISEGNSPKVESRVESASQIEQKDISIGDLLDTINSSKEPIYARWSSGPLNDMKHGARSFDYQANEYHSGLSAVEIPKGNDRFYIAKRLAEYAHFGGGLHFYKGVVVGEDSDGYPSIKPIAYMGSLEPAYLAYIQSGSYRLDVLEKRLIEAETKHSQANSDFDRRSAQRNIDAIKYEIGQENRLNSGAVARVREPALYVANESRTDFPDLGDGQFFGRPRQSRVASEIDLTEVDGANLRSKLDAKLDRFRTAMQDRYLPLLRVQQRVESATGKPLPLGANPYLREELMTGRMGNQLERLSDNMIDPLFSAMHSAGVTPEELETYLYARHAPERNAQIAKINEAMPDGGSGMSDIEAAAIMTRVKRSGREDTLAALAGMVDDIHQFALKTRIDAGLLSADEAKAWQETYEFYVPLRGQEEVQGDATGLTARINRSGGGLTVTGKESKRAYGRRSKADNILAYTLLQAEEAIVRAETNRVATAFANLAQRAPDPEFWEVDKVTRKAVMDSNTGMVRYESQTRIQMEDKDYTVIAKVNGDEVRVTMNRYNPSARRLADSMKNLTQHQLAWFVIFLGTPSRFLSAVNTSWNPEFIITNAFRDIQSAALNIAGLERDKLLTGTMRDYRKALVASTKGAFGKGQGEWSRWYNEFSAEGGRVYFNKIDNLDDLKKRITDSMAKADGRLTVKRSLLAVRDFVEAANSGVENAVRLSVYKNARELGMTKAQAASIAKNVTVNFNRRGTAGPMMNAAFMFFNASVQGTARLVLALRSKRVQKVMAGVVLGSFALEMLNAMLSDDDDDGESFYDKISAFDKNRNIIIMIPGGGGNHVKIPMPYGYNVFAAMGRTAAEIMRRGGDRGMESMGDFATAVVDAFNPVGGTESLANLISPTIFDPIIDLERNRDFTDRPIMPEENQFGPKEPDAQRYFGSVSPVWRAVTDTLTQMTGGDDIVAGAIDVSPETLEYLAGTVFGAAGNFLNRQISLGAKALDPDVDVEASDLPLARKLFASKPSWYDRSAYYDRMDQIERSVADAGDYLERGDQQRFESYVNANERLLTLEADMKAARREMRAIRKAKGELELANRLGQIDNATYRTQRNAYGDAEDVIIRAFNTRWNQVMHPPEAE